MPAIHTSVTHTSTEVILNHNSLSGHFVLNTNFGHARFLGFICTQGAAHLETARLARVKAKGISNGDGHEGGEWKILHEADWIYAMIIIGGGNPREECYIVVDDNGWPIVADTDPPTYLPSDVHYRRSETSLFGHGAVTRK